MSSTTNWFDLPFVLKSNILSRIGNPEILKDAQKVCKDWYKVCKDPYIWKVIDLYSLRSSFVGDMAMLRELSKHVVDRSQGQLVDIVIPGLRTGEVLMYVADRASQLKRLNMVIGGYGIGDTSIISLPEALKKFPLLEELRVDFYFLPKEAIEIAGRYCPLLKTLEFCRAPCMNDNINDEIAMSIGENLHGLRHLKLWNDNLSDIGLKAILDGCPHLESLDLSYCDYIDLNGDLVKRASKQIKHLTLRQKPILKKFIMY
ncbi:putative F-box/LRR-repeat protein 23 [Rutidosis leptorrhynchoides]|uniref:putative F-box/LRR-repeat protein 23 n=1 Tax=Rutidosis leptorrhynchoides TaxID=125765 RepID=UPI003A990FB0